jgi:hypothetical protein
MTTVQRSNMTQTDAKGKVLRESKETNANTSVNFRWWLSDDITMAQDIAGTIRFIQTHQGSRMEQLTVSTRLYGMNTAYNLIGTAFTRASSVNATPSTQRISFNLVESIIDTLESKMAKNSVIPTYITNGGLWDVQKKAKDLTKFTQGLFYQEKVHKKSIDSWGDGAVWGDGFVQVFEKDDKVQIERVLPHELFVDMIETLTGQPTQLHRVKYMDRDRALAILPELEENIMTVAPAAYQDVGGSGTVADLITVTESWHLRSGPTKKDGLHVFCVGDGALPEDYNKDYFPFPHFRYAKRKLGWYGQGAAERLQNFQGEVNRCMLLKQRALWMQSAFKVLIEQGSKVVDQHISNEVGTLIHYVGTPPQYIAPPATNPELQLWIDRLIQLAYQQEGVSFMTSTGEVPLGIQSGTALRTLNQISDDRFLFMQQELEDYSLEIARQGIEVVRDIYKRKHKYEIIFPNTQFMETIDWKDIQLDESQYVLKAFPTSSLSEDLTGRLAEIDELEQKQHIDKQTARQLLDMPDLEMNNALVNAPFDLLSKIFEEMLNDNKMTKFEPAYHDATLAQKLALQYINYGELNQCPDERIQLVRNFLAQVLEEAIMPQIALGATPEQPEQGPAPAPAPQAEMQQQPQRMAA